MCMIFTAQETRKSCFLVIKETNIILRSIADSLYKALALVTSKVLWIIYLLKELKLQLMKSLVLHYNNKSA